ncbi:hypothetical protein [Methylobacterium cerastii]|nr:hypothetical protein [Methylobacterium cerastii]
MRPAMNIGNLVLGSIILYLYFYFFDLQYYSKSDALGQDPSSIMGAFLDKRLYNLFNGPVEDVGTVASKVSAACWTTVVMLPALYHFYSGQNDWILHALGYVGLTFLLGPAAIKDASALRPKDKAVSFSSKVGRWLFRKVFYGASDKINVITKIAVISFLLWTSRKLFGWPSEITSYIPHAPWFPEQIGHERSNIISDAVWIVMFFILAIKTITSPGHMSAAWGPNPTRKTSDVEGVYYLFSRGLVAILTIHFIASYTAVITHPLARVGFR